MKADLLALVADPKPWIGSTYLLQRLRILVLGESHKMAAGDDVPTAGAEMTEYTIRAVTWRILGRDHNPFFANVEQILFDEPSRLDQPGHGDQEVYARSDFWHSVAFSNFVPRIMSDQKERPSAADFKAGTLRLISLLHALEPDIVCLFSATAFDHHRPWGEAPNFDGLGTEPEHICETLTRYSHPHRKPYYLARFGHPSRGSPSKMRDEFQFIRQEIDRLTAVG